MLLKPHSTIVIIFLLLMFGGTGKTFSQTLDFYQTIRGTILDTDSKSPVIGANVIVLNSDPLLGGTTDLNGVFKIANVPINERVNLKISCIGYEEIFVEDLLLNSAKEMILSLEMKESMIKMEELVITDHEAVSHEVLNEMAQVSARRFSVEETKRYAGSLNDPARMVSAFAGNTSDPGGNNDIIVRGNSPKGVQWRLEGVEIPNPNHFGSEGGTGGPINALNSTMLSNSDFYSGAFPADYGNAYSGVFDMRLRKGNDEKREYTLSAGVVGTDVTLEGPFKKGSSSYLINGRYSTLAIFDELGILDFDGVPKYRDLSFKIFVPTQKTGTFTLFGLGGKSNIYREEYDEEDEDLMIETGDYKADMGIVGLSHQYLLGKDSYIENILSFSTSGSGFYEEDLNNDDEMEMYYDGYFRNNYISISSNLHHKLNARNKIQFGMTYKRTNFDYYVDYRNDETNRIEREVDSKGKTGVYNAYASWKYRINTDLTFVGGMNIMGSEMNSKQSLEPRASLKWQFTPSQSLTAAFGVHGKMESLVNYYATVTQEDGTVIRPNTKLDFMKARHYVLGYTNILSQNVLFKAEIYYQDLFNIPVEDDPESSYSTINQSEGYVNKSLVNKGTGYNYGLELTLEKQFSNNYYFMATTSVFESKYKAMDGELRNSRYGVGHISNFLFGKEMHVFPHKKNLHTISLNTKLTLIGGNRETPINLPASIESGEEKLFEDQAYSKKMENVFIGNLAIIYRISSKKISQEFKIDLQNFMNHQAKIGHYYDDRSESIKYDTQLPLLPIIFYSVQF